MDDFIHDLYTMIVMGMGKKLEINEKQGKKIPVFLPSLKSDADYFPGRKNRKQAGTTLGTIYQPLRSGRI